MNSHTHHNRKSLCRLSGIIVSVIMWLPLLLVPAASLSSEGPENPTITLAFANEPLPPFLIFEQDGDEFTGIWPTIFQSLFVERLGWKVKYIFRPWQRAQNDVKIGNADGLVTVITAERLEYAVPVPGVFCTFPINLFSWKGHPALEEMKKVRSVDELADLDLTLVSNIGNGWYKSNIEQKGVKTIWLPTDEQVVKFVSFKRGDAVIELPSTIENLTSTNGLEGKLVDTGVTFGSLQVNIMIGKTSPFVERIHEIEDALTALREDSSFVEQLRRMIEYQNTGNSCCLCNKGEGH